MIRVVPQPEPDDFDNRVREPGSWAIAELAGQPSHRTRGRRLPQVASTRGAFTDVLDPFCIEDDWFVMDIVEFRVHPGTSLDASRKQSVAASINRLRLNDLDWCETRRQLVDCYRKHRRLHIVDHLFPFVAKEIRRLGL